MTSHDTAKINANAGSAGSRAHQLTVDNFCDRAAGGRQYNVSMGENHKSVFEMALLDAGYSGWSDQASGVIGLLGQQ